MNQPARTTSHPDAGPAHEHKVHYGRIDVAICKRQVDERTWYSFSL